MTVDTKDQLVRMNVAARELGLHPRTVKKYCQCQKLRCRQLPMGHWRVYRSSLDELICELKPSETDTNRN